MRIFSPHGRVVSLVVLFFALLLLAPVGAETLPEMRPAFFAPSSQSLVNLIDTEALFRKGQRDAWVMFSCGVRHDGMVDQASGIVAFRASPGADLLKSEVARKLRATHFVPAVYEHKNVPVGVTGTVIFVVTDGKPRVRVFLNQEMDELKRGSDFVAPQFPWALHGLELGGLGRPGDRGGTIALVKVRHSVDAMGKTTDVQVINENPSGQGFGESAANAIRRRRYLPAYRNGKPTACTITFEFRLLSSY